MEAKTPRTVGNQLQRADNRRWGVMGAVCGESKEEIRVVLVMPECCKVSCSLCVYEAFRVAEMNCVLN